jgi:hypothetical protein
MKKDSDYSLASTAHRVYGFLPDPSKNFWENRLRILGETTPFHYYSRPSNMSYHNLCTDAKTPPGIASLLGMGLKFCIESARPNQRINEGIRRFQRSVRLHFHFAEEESKKANDNDTESVLSDSQANASYIPSLYLPSPWEPPPKRDDVELALANFDRRLNDCHRALPKHRRHNLSPAQRNAMKELRDRQDLIIHQSDKNLGPTVSQRPKYM